MSNTFSIVELWLWFWNYIFFGRLIPIVTMVLIVMYIRGRFVQKKINSEKLNSGFSISEVKFSPSYSLFNGVNKALDNLIGFTLNQTQKRIWEPVYGFFLQHLPDERIQKILSKLGADNSFKHRVEIARREFDEAENAFWWNKERAPDFRQVSPIISGNWFNGKPVEDYLSFLIHPKTFYACVRTGLIVAIASFIVLAIVYKPQVFLGWQSNTILQRMAEDTAKRIVADPSIIPEFRKDVWSAEEQAEINSKAFVVSQIYAKKILNNSDGYSYQPWGFIFKNGIMTDLFLALAIGLFYIRKSYYYSFKALKIPFIKDSHELKGYEQKIGSITQYKLTLAASNTKATGFDRHAPLIASFVSSGIFEDRGQIGARRKNQVIYQSTNDKSQNTVLFGGTGVGKTKLIIEPEVNSWFDLKNIFLKYELQYEKMFDTRLNALTPYAISLGYLEEYTKLPYNPTNISTSVMDIKAQIWKDVKESAERKHLGGEFKIVGADEETGQLAIDIWKGLDPAKIKAIFSTITSQMGMSSELNVWTGTALDNTERFSDVQFLFERSRAGMRYMREYGIKVWSPSFLTNLALHDHNSTLLAHAIYSIYTEIQEEPERFADIFTEQSRQSLLYLMTEWQDFPEETKGGFRANMSFMMSGYNNEKLKPFLTGIGENMTSIAELRKYICAFDLDTDRYKNSGKLVLLIIKTLIFEESVNRQIRFSRRIQELTEIYRSHYPNILILDTSVEMLPITSFANEDSIAELDKYHELCNRIMNELSNSRRKDSEENIVVWDMGAYQSELNKIISSFPHIPGLDDFNSEYSAELLSLAKQANDCAEKIRALEPRLSKELKGIASINPEIFKADERDSVEVKERKRDHLKLFYEYQDVKTRIAREHMLFIGDEYQELITLDKTGGCYSDYNFPNLSRSTNFKYFVATQTENAFELKIDKVATKNFLNQMRTVIYMVSEDDVTAESVSKLAGSADMFQNANVGKPLLNSKVPTDFTIYGNFNHYISSRIAKNKSLESHGLDYKVSSDYPYTFDIFTTAEPIEIPTKELKFDTTFSNLFSHECSFDIPSMKRHFLDETGIPEFKRTGSDIQGKQTNAEAIQSAWKQSRQSMDEKYQSFLNDGFKKDVPLLTQSDFSMGGSVYAFISMQRAGMTIKDYVIVPPKNYYMND